MHYLSLCPHAPLSFCFRSRSRALLSPPLSCRAPLSLSPTRCSRSSLSLSLGSRAPSLHVSHSSHAPLISHSHIIHICDCLCVLRHALRPSPCARGAWHERMCVVCYCLCVQVHCVVWLWVRGRGRHGYEVRCAGGGIGAGFPSVSFCGPVTLTSYLLPVKRYWCWFWSRGVLICCVNGCQYNLDKILIM